MGLKIFGLVAFLSVSAVSMSLQAQSSSDDYNAGMKQELNQEIDQLYPKRPKRVVQQVQPEVIVNEEVQPAVPRQAQVAPPPASQPIYILQQPTGIPQAQAQPPTTVEAPAAKESKGEALRRQREDVEHQTEDKLTEKLENDRLQAEKDRADRLFAPPVVVATPAPTPVPAPVPVVVAPTPAPVPVAPEPELVPISRYREDELPPKDEEESAKFSIGALAGIGAYPTLSNVNGAYAAGVEGELTFPERFGINLSTVFSNYSLTNANPYTSASYILNVNQFNITGGVNYHILEGRISPVIGLLTGYTRRDYSSSVSYGAPNPNTGSSAFDGGFLVGVDIKCTQRLTVGADLRYMMNISYRTDNPLAYSSSNNTPYGYSVPTSPLEASSYYFATLNLKLSL